MSSASSKIPAKHVLRGILRSLKVKRDDLPKVRPTMDYVLERYRSDREQREATTSTEGDSSVRDQELSKLAYEYMILLRDIDERKRLQQLDTGAEKQLSPREMSRRAAARAGLQLPQLNPDLPE
jgi:hypothetical protein